MTGFSIENWVNENPDQRPFREAVHTILFAISNSPELREIMVMKGGILLALNYQSSRFTRDIDFSTNLRLAEIDLDSRMETFEEALSVAVDSLSYETDCLVHNWKQEPPGEDKDFPTIRIKVGYAARGDQNAHRRLLAKHSIHVVTVDLSLNEPQGDPEMIEIQDGQTVQVYSLHDLVAEKYRAILQQEVRNRFRRQDVYDLHRLLVGETEELLTGRRGQVLASLKIKAEARDLPVNRESMDQPEIIERSRAEYRSLVPEIEGPLPDFDDAYYIVKSYYQSLPWE